MDGIASSYNLAHRNCGEGCGYFGCTDRQAAKDEDYLPINCTPFLSRIHELSGLALGPLLGADRIKGGTTGIRDRILDGDSRYHQHHSLRWVRKGELWAPLLPAIRRQDVHTLRHGHFTRPIQTPAGQW